MKFFLLLITISVAFGCSNSATDELKSIPVGESVNKGAKPIILEVDHQDVSFIPLSTQNEAYLSHVSIIGANNKQMVMMSDNKLFIYDANNGSLISKIDRKGKGPQEYSWLSSGVVDFENEAITIYDIQLKNLLKYGFNGDFLGKIMNDSIIWLASNGESVVAFNNPNVDTKHQFGIYDRSWNLKRSTLEKESVDLKANVLRIVGMFNHRNTLYVTIKDTLSIFTPEFDLKQYLTFDKGSLKCPSDVENDRTKYDLLTSYITSDYATLLGDYVYYRYMYKERNYQDLWDLNTMKLAGRNIIEGAVDPNTLVFTPKEGQTDGISIKYGDKIIKAGSPRYVVGNKTYFVLEQTYVNDMGIFDTEQDNPVIMSVVLK